MQYNKGITIESIAPGSLAEAAGLCPGDILYDINSSPMRDVIDFMFHKDEDQLNIKFRRENKRKRLSISADSNAELGITFRPMKVKTCRNNCVFCFVKQLPKGLRKPLYIKDEDYRLSFLYGNYTTLSNITAEEKKRIIQQRLSPMYISVHTTDRALRNRMLGNPKASDILRELKFFAENKIRMHIQIVVCPGINDAGQLQSTIQDLQRFHPYVSSVAVVPVGLTRHRKTQITPMSKEVALKTVDIVHTFQKRFRKKHGESIVYCADEMYIKAETPFPPLQDYGELPQIENGVGMVPLFISQAQKPKIPKMAGKKSRVLTFTGTSFYPYLAKFIDRVSGRENLPIGVIPVKNTFFGETVTVAGLLTGRDVISAIHDNTDDYDVIAVPDVLLREGDTLFLDNVSVQDLEEATGLKVVVTESSPQGLIDTLAGLG